VKIGAWCAAVPASFRFVVKAQRGAGVRALYGDEVSSAASVAWLTADLAGFGERLGAVLFRVGGEIRRDDARLARLLGNWPRSIPLVLEAQHPSWHVDETFAALRAAGAVLCTTDLDGPDGPRDLDGPDGLMTEPDIRRTGPFLYLRLRRTTYDDTTLDAWARRIIPFLDDGMDAFVLFRHDEDGTSALHAEGFAARVERIRAER